MAKNHYSQIHALDAHIERERGDADFDSWLEAGNRSPSLATIYEACIHTRYEVMIIRQAKLIAPGTSDYSLAGIADRIVRDIIDIEETEALVLNAIIDLTNEIATTKRAYRKSQASIELLAMKEIVARMI